MWATMGTRFPVKCECAIRLNNFARRYSPFIALLISFLHKTARCIFVYSYHAAAQKKTPHVCDVFLFVSILSGAADRRAFLRARICASWVPDITFYPERVCAIRF